MLEKFNVQALIQFYFIFQNHLINEHGALDNCEYLISLTLIKKENNDELPQVGDLSKKSEDNSKEQEQSSIEVPVKVKVETCDAEVQTEEDLEQVCMLLSICRVNHSILFITMTLNDKICFSILIYNFVVDFFDDFYCIIIVSDVHQVPATIIK